jgi:hypothetical protein
MYFCYCPISKFILNKNIGLKAIVITRYFWYPERIVEKA